MRTLFIPARSTIEIEIDDTVLQRLPQVVAVVSTVQYLHVLEGLKKRLLKLGKKVISLRCTHCPEDGQVLGCTSFKEDEIAEVEAILYVGTGKFHPKALGLRSGKIVHTYNPISKAHDVLREEDITHLRRKEKAALVMFHSAKKIGVLFTTKPGQSRVQFSIERVGELEQAYPDKEFFVLVDNTFTPQALEDFTFINCFVNTACPNVTFDEGFPKSVVNIENIL